jgi:hypothetical protein
MFDFVNPHDGPVIPGLEGFETVYAKNQPEYRPVRTLPTHDGQGAVMRMHFTDAQRKAIAEGADIYLNLLHFGRPLAPSLVMVMSEPADSDIFRAWWKAQTRGSYWLPNASVRLPEGNDNGSKDAKAAEGDPVPEAGAPSDPATAAGSDSAPPGGPCGTAEQQ